MSSVGLAWLPLVALERGAGRRGAGRVAVQGHAAREVLGDLQRDGPAAGHVPHEPEVPLRRLSHLYLLFEVFAPKEWHIPSTRFEEICLKTTPPCTRFPVSGFCSPAVAVMKAAVSVFSASTIIMSSNLGGATLKALKDKERRKGRKENKRRVLRRFLSVHLPAGSGLLGLELRDEAADAADDEPVQGLQHLLHVLA